MLLHWETVARVEVWLLTTQLTVELVAELMMETVRHLLVEISEVLEASVSTEAAVQIAAYNNNNKHNSLNISPAGQPSLRSTLRGVLTTVGRTSELERCTGTVHVPIPTVP